MCGLKSWPAKRPPIAEQASERRGEGKLPSTVVPATHVALRGLMCVLLMTAAARADAPQAPPSTSLQFLQNRERFYKNAGSISPAYFVDGERDVVTIADEIRSLVFSQLKGFVP